MREEVRTAWLQALRRRAGLAEAAGDPDQAVASLVRLRAADPFDEPAHRRLVGVLVRAGRHGQARRAFGEWAHAMRAIDAPTPDPGVLRVAQAAGSSPQ
jgi:DNA-binding SARP family transcriptional activator